MTVDELVRRRVVAMLAPALGQHVLFVTLHHWEPLDFPKITAEAGFSRHVPINSRQPAHDLHPLQATSPAKLVSKQNYRASNPIVNLISKHYYLFRRRPCAHAKRQSSWCRWDGTYRPRAMMANSLQPNGWRSASSPAPTSSPGTHRLWQGFKRLPAAAQRMSSNRLRRVGTWHERHRRRIGEAYVCD